MKNVKSVKKVVKKTATTTTTPRDPRVAVSAKRLLMLKKIAKSRNESVKEMVEAVFKDALGK